MVKLQPKTWGGFWDIFGKILADSLGIERGARVLDFGTGEGSTLYPAAKMVGKSGRVIGIEKDELYVKRTSDEIERYNIKNAEVHHMDGREMSFENCSFDYVMAGFIGWNNYFDFANLKYRHPDRMLKEIRRVLKDGGKLGVSTWLVQSDLDWMYQFLTSLSIPCNTMYSAENAEGWKIIMESEGFTEVEFFAKSESFTYESIDAWWKEMMEYDWITKESDRNLINDTVQEKAYQKVQNHLTANGGIKFERDALFVIGKKVD